MPVEVRITDRADQQLSELNKRSRQRFHAFTTELALHGCEALQYRLTGPSPLDHFCVKHLDNALRVVVAFETKSLAWILLIGPHDDASSSNVYTELYELAGTQPPDSLKRTKPPCCEPSQQRPPTLEGSVVDLLDRVTRVRGTRSRSSRQQRLGRAKGSGQ